MEATADLGVTWHLVGHLQSNKARKAAARFDWIHSLDSVELLHKLDEGAQAAGRTVMLLVQVDLAGEPAKHGARPEDLSAILRTGRDCRFARIAGLMLLPPAVEDPAAARPFFRALADLRQRLVDDGADRAALEELSMGMSHDFEVAIEEGATMIRVGSAIFGERGQA
jgi:pyridoxal phosphate enzyme (YggS family)